MCVCLFNLNKFPISVHLQKARLCSVVAGVGVYISRVEEGSVAERSGLRPGDTILEVNGTPFTAIGHEEALKVIIVI